MWWLQAYFYKGRISYIDLLFVAITYTSLRKNYALFYVSSVFFLTLYDFVKYHILNSSTFNITECVFNNFRGLFPICLYFLYFLKPQTSLKI